MLTIDKNGHFGIANEYDQTVDPIITAVENVQDQEDVNIFKESDITNAEYRRLNANQRKLESQKEAQKNRQLKEQYVKAYNSLYRKQVEAMNRAGAKKETDLMLNAVKSGRNMELWDGSLGPSHDYPRIVSSARWGGEMKGAPQMGFDLGNWWDTFTQSAESQAEAEIAKQGQQLVTQVVQQVTGQQPSSGTVATVPPTSTSTVKPPSTLASAFTLTPQMKKYLLYAGIGFVSIFALMIILRMTKKSA